MAGLTSGFHIVAKGDIEGLMRIRMAAETVFQGEMRFAFMAVRALGYKRALFNSWRMCTVMTLETCYLCLVFGTCFVYLFDKGDVTFFTVFIIELGTTECGFSRLDTGHHAGENKTEQGRYCQQNRTSHLFPLYRICESLSKITGR